MTDEPTTTRCAGRQRAADRCRPHVRARFRWTLVLGILALLLGGLSPSSSVAGEAKALSEEQLKAAFILNFPKYVEWPANTFTTPDAPIVLGMLGDEKLAAETENMGSEKSINGRRLVIRQLTADDSLDGCHLLFVSSTQQRHTPGILEKLKHRHILTVGEDADFLKEGGVINLVLKDRKIGLEVNLAAAAAADLKVSSKLLGVATVKGRPN